LAKASIDFWVCDSESGQTAALSLLDWASVRVEKTTKVASSFTDKRIARHLSRRIFTMRSL
jgi:hypothetical protein